MTTKDGDTGFFLSSLNVDNMTLVLDALPAAPIRVTTRIMCSARTNFFSNLHPKIFNSCFPRASRSGHENGHHPSRGPGSAEGSLPERSPECRQIGARGAETVRQLEVEMRAKEQAMERVADLTLQYDEVVRTLEEVRGQLTAVQEKLRQEQQRTGALSADCRRFKVLLARETEHRQMEEEKWKERQKLVDEYMSQQILGLGMNIQAKFPTLPELGASIRRTMSSTVSSLADKLAGVALGSLLSNRSFLPEILVLIFKSCQRHIQARRGEIVSNFLGNVDGATEEDMDSATANFMRRYLCRHHLTLFPLQGDMLEHTVQATTQQIATELSRSTYLEVDSDASAIEEKLRGSGIRGVIMEYLKILVFSTLQHPVVHFTDDCGKVQEYQKDLHFPPIDGERVQPTCTVVFPALLTGEARAGGSGQVLSKRFVLALVEDGCEEIEVSDSFVCFVASLVLIPRPCSGLGGA